MKAYINKEKFTKAYSKLVTSNMSDGLDEKGKYSSHDDDFSRFAGFLMKHSFKSIRLQVEKESKVFAVRYDPNRSYFPIESHWHSLNETKKLELLMAKFDFETILNEWIDVLPTYKNLYCKFKLLTDEQKQIILNRLEE